MSEPRQQPGASLAKHTIYEAGPRSSIQYRDLGIDAATHGRFQAESVPAAAAAP